MEPIIRRREELERCEAQTLAPYAALSSKTAGREHAEPPGVNRTNFQRDWHRITHTQAFRKLEFKTQVFIFGEGLDVSRNRLTHTLEVAQIATSVCRSLGLNEDLANAISLAHDLGHAPFGHAGEEALEKCVRDFNHNVHSLRIVRELEKRYPDFDGLNLCKETLEGIEKHDTRYDQVEKERHLFFTGRMPTLEAQVASVADSTAYTSHDIEDALLTGILTLGKLHDAGLDLWAMLWERVKDLPEPVLMPQVTRNLIDILVTDILSETEARIARSAVKSLADVRAAKTNLASFSPEMEERVAKMSAFLHAEFYNDYRIKRMTRKGQKIITSLFEAYRDSPDILPTQIQAEMTRARHKGKETLRVIADFIAGMTDVYAMDEYERIFNVSRKV
jgi:dGTPase